MEVLIVRLRADRAEDDLRLDAVLRRALAGLAHRMAEDVSALLEQGGSTGIRITDDFAGIPRMVEAVWS